MERHARKSGLKKAWLVAILLLLSGCEGCPFYPPPVGPPEIHSLTASRFSVEPGDTSTVTVVAYDPEGDPLTYSWTATGGTVSPSSSYPEVTWTAPLTPDVTYRVIVIVSDNQGAQASRSINIAVADVCLLPFPLLVPARDNIAIEGWQEVPAK